MKKILLKTISFCWVVIFLMSTATSLDNMDPPREAFREDIGTCSLENNAFQDGERITYKLFYNWKFVWIAAGEVTFKVKDMGDQFHISAVGRTYKSYDPFFKVRDRYECYIDKQTLLPSVALREVEEGKYRLYDKVTFDRKQQKIKSLRGKSQDVAKEAEYEMGSCIHDILSIIYYARNINFEEMEKGDKIPVNLFMDKEVWPLNVTYKGKQEKKRIKGNGKFKTMQFSPELITGEYFTDGTDMNIFVSDDKNRIPLIIESPLSVGSMKVVLKKYSGLKYEMDADL